MTETGKIIDKLKEKKVFSEVSIEEFAPDGKWAYKIAEDIANDRKVNMKVSQLRKVFTKIKNMEEKIKGTGKGNEFSDPELYDNSTSSLRQSKELNNKRFL